LEAIRDAEIVRGEVIALQDALNAKLKEYEECRKPLSETEPLPDQYGQTVVIPGDPQNTDAFLNHVMITEEFGKQDAATPFEVYTDEPTQETTAPTWGQVHYR
jgi:hypothetical protein